MEEEFASAWPRTMREVEGKIDLFALKLRNPKGRESSPSVQIIASHIGVAQVGDHATAIVQNGMDKATTERLRDLLQQVEEHFLRHGGDHPERHEVLEMVTDVRNEVAKPTPSKSRLKGALFGIKNALEIVAALKPASEWVQEMMGLLP
jgi:hypothetical protein